MKLDQGMMDAYTLGATKGGVLDWKEREDILGIGAVLNLIDPVPEEMNVITDNDDCRWRRSDFDEMVWHHEMRVMSPLTAAAIQREYGIKEWSAE